MTGFCRNLLWLLPVALAGCEQSPEAPREAELAQLVALQEDFDGRRIETSGRIETFETPRHYWLADDEFNRVGLSPGEKARDHVGQQVRVTGTFSYSAEQGRLIEVKTLVPEQADSR